MKKIALLLIAICYLCSGCTNEEDTIAWIKSHKKPITCKLAGKDGANRSIYTLIDADGNIFATGYIEMLFPDTIKTAIK